MIKKYLEKFNPYSKTFQICWGIFTAILMCAIKNVEVNETLYDVIKLQARFIEATFILYFIQILIEKYVDKKDIEAQAIYGIVLAFWLIITFFGMTRNFPVIENILFILIIPGILFIDMSKFKWNWYVATLTLMTIFIVAWQ